MTNISLSEKEQILIQRHHSHISADLTKTSPASIHNQSQAIPIFQKIFSSSATKTLQLWNKGKNYYKHKKSEEGENQFRQILLPNIMFQILTLFFYSMLIKIFFS